jgi:hypothetical protein
MLQVERFFRLSGKLSLLWSSIDECEFQNMIPRELFSGLNIFGRYGFHFVPQNHASHTTPNQSTILPINKERNATFQNTCSIQMKFSWTKLLPKPDPKYGVPCARSSHGVSFLAGSDRLILYGGEHVARTPITDSTFWLCEHVTTEPTWKFIEPTPTTAPPPRVAHAQAVYDDRYVYIFGGRTGIHMDEQPMNDLWVWDSTDLQWSPVVPQNANDVPLPRSFHRMICLGSALYVFGGCGTNGRLNDLHKFDIPNKTWYNLGSSSLLRGRGGPNVIPIASGQKIAIVAGFAGEETNDGHVFDLENTAWHEKATDLEKLRPRSVCVSGSFPSCGVSVIFGGEVDPSDRGHEGAGGFANDIVVLDETTGALQETILPPPSNQESAPWPGPRGWSDAASADLGNGSGQLYLFGGLSGDDTNPRRLDDLWKLEVQKD